MKHKPSKFSVGVTVAFLALTGAAGCGERGQTALYKTASTEASATAGWDGH